MLAIVIPYYKLTFFEATLQSLANQTDKRFSVYIGDDCSPENCQSLLKKIENQFDFIYHRFESNLGGTSLPKQWERCIGLTKDEEWIMILGDDDVLGENVVEAFYDNYQDFIGKSNVIRFATQLIYQNSNTSSHVFEHPVFESATDSFYRKFRNWSRSSLSEHIFSRASYNKYGFHDYPLAWNSDDRAWLDFSDGKPIYSINNSIVYVRISDLNISGRDDNKVLKNKSVKSFYRHIVLTKLKFFDKEQRYRLLKRYFKEIKSSKNLSLQEWGTLLFAVIRNFDLNWIKKHLFKIRKYD